VPLVDTTALYVYLGIFGMLVAAGLGFPIPEEIPIVLAGASVAKGPTLDEPIYLHWWIMLPVCIAGVVIADGLLFGIGRYFGVQLLEFRWVQKRLLPPEKRARIEGNFHRYGVKILLAARFLPGIRAPIFITAGIMRLPLSLFILADGLYAVPGVTLLFTLSFWFTDQFVDLVRRVEARMAMARPLVVLILITAVGAYLLYAFYRRSMVTGVTGDPQKEIPLIGKQVAARIEGDHPEIPSSRPPAEKKSDDKPSDRPA
jgi:membrane protein DedA with SNARE-associated domain